MHPIVAARNWPTRWCLPGAYVETITDAQGRYRFLGVPTGGALLQLFPGPGDALHSDEAVEPFEVKAGKSYTFDLQLPAAK